MDKKLFANLDEQMNLEYESAYIYKAMAAYAAEEDWTGSEHWFNEQAREEIEHAEKFRNFLHDKGFKVSFKGMKAAKTDYKSLLEAFQTALEHEQFITKSIKKLYKEAVEKEDYEVQVFLNWFIEEQVEEEANVGAVVARLEKIGDSTNGLFMMDKALGKREE